MCSVETLSYDFYATLASVTNLCRLRQLLYAGSESNYSMLTFDGVDVMGSRLADEVCTGFYIKF